jgi:hypothetical protein
MKIDEAIAFCHEKSKNIKLKAEPQVFIDIADWLEELKFRRVLQLKYEKSFFAGYKHGYSDGYNKAIDDFVKMAKEVKYQDGALSDIDLEYIAQQLKAGRKDGSERADS